jgi:flagellar biogenesis protein FliO
MELPSRAQATELPGLGGPLTQATELPSLGGSLAVTFLALGLVCLLAYFSLKWMARRGVGQPSGPIRVIARVSPEPKRSLLLIETAGRCFLVGASDGGVNLLAEVDPKEVQLEQPARSRFTGVPGGRFGEILARVLARPGARNPTSETSAPAPATTAPVAAPPPREPEFQG